MFLRTLSLMLTSASMSPFPNRLFIRISQFMDFWDYETSVNSNFNRCWAHDYAFSGKSSFGHIDQVEMDKLDCSGPVLEKRLLCSHWACSWEVHEVSVPTSNLVRVKTLILDHCGQKNPWVPRAAAVPCHHHHPHRGSPPIMSLYLPHGFGWLWILSFAVSSAFKKRSVIF